MAGTTLAVRRPAPPRPATGSPGRRPRLHGLTALRYLACVAVLLVHVRFQFTTAHGLRVLASYGYVGVTFFFLLSGFVLTWSWSDRPARRFWWGRLARIWPAQFLLMVVAFTLVAGQERIPGPLGKAAEVLMLQAWIPDRTVYFGGNGVAWSLSCEMFFYLLFPLVVPWLARLGRRGLSVVAGATVTVLLGAPVVLGPSLSDATYYWLFYVFPPYRFGEFLLGMVLARAALLGLRVRRPRRTGLLAAAWLAVLVAGATWLDLATGSGPARPFVALAVLPPLALLLLACTSAELAGRRGLLQWRPLVLLGEWSFALFLVHKPLILFTQRWHWWANTGGLDALAHFLAFLALATAVAAVLHHTVEKPVERVLRRLPARLAPAG